MAASQKPPVSAHALEHSHAQHHPLTLHGSDIAPIISFDEVPFFGSLHGIGRITLAAQVLTNGKEEGSISADHVVTVHLRGSLRAMMALRDTIDKMLLAATPISGPEN